MLLGLVVGLLPASVPDDAVPRVDRVVLTADGPSYTYERAGRRLTVHAGAGSEDPNRREVVLASGPATRDQTVCATWVRETGWRVQPGLAVRGVHSGGRVRAVTLTKNIAFGIQTVLNVVTWDTARRGDPWRTVAQLDLAAVLMRHGRLRPMPWRACLRVHDRRVRIKVWLPARSPEPSWSDPVAARTARLPRAFVLAGRPGWYVGHLPAGGSVRYRNLTVSRD